jgi:long-chain acyl-CoA synthetase
MSSSIVQREIAINEKKIANIFSFFSKKRLIFSKIRAIFGGRLRYMACGSAPISNKVIDFFKAVLCIPVLEGYG